MIDEFVEKVQTIRQVAEKKNKNSAIFITNFLTEENNFIFNAIKESNNHVYGYCEINDIELTKMAVSKIDGIVEYIILDIRIYHLLKEDIRVSQSQTFVYNDEKCWSDSIISLLYAFRKQHSFSKVLIGGNSALTLRIINDVCDMSEDISSLSDINHPRVIPVGKNDLISKKFDLLISTDYKQICFDDTYTNLINYSTFIVDAGIHGFSKNFIKKHFELGSTIIRMDNRAALSSILTSILENYDLCENVMGEFVYEGIRVVAGGVMGMENNIIVDNISNPSTIIGIASGDGQTLYNINESRYVKVIQELIKGKK